MSLLGALRRIENGADMWLASSEGASSKYSEAVSMLHTFAQYHPDASITNQPIGIKCQFMYNLLTVRIYIKPGSFVIETWDKTERTGYVQGDFENNTDCKTFRSMLQSYNKKG